MRSLILGLDSFDPCVFERLSASGRLPNLTRYAEAQGYARFGVTYPPQSEVSWTSIATGLDPGGHGIFDFVHRNPKSYSLSVSLLPTTHSLTGTQFVPPFRSRTLFDQAVDDGYPATVLWWPATFPARPESPIRTVPGLGTPDIHGRLGIGTLFSSHSEPRNGGRKTTQLPLTRVGSDRYRGLLPGPVRQRRKGETNSEIEIRLERLGERQALIQIGSNSFEVSLGEWSPVLELQFKLGFMVRVRALTRIIVTELSGDVRMYVLPLQLHPLRSPWRYGSPQRFVKQMWRETGPFLTIGWPQDTIGLEEQCITDDQFLSLCNSIFTTRQRILMQQLQNFDEGIIASVFDTLDRVQHMFWRDRMDIVEMWYEKLDTLVGSVNKVISGRQHNTRMLIVSDHGFSDFAYKVHLNRWLVDNGYLILKDTNGDAAFDNVDWEESRVYAIGLNSVYVNQAGREGQGCIDQTESANIVKELQAKFAQWKGPDGRSVIQQALANREAFSGPYAIHGPDLVVGYAKGYRASSETGLGRWGQDSIEENHDHWGADHCIDADAVPGVLFTNEDLRDFPAPSFKDFPALAIGNSIRQSDEMIPSPSLENDEDQKTLEERLRSLGYL